MTNPAKADPLETRIVVHAWDFLEALKIAVLFTKRDMHPGVRIDLDDETPDFHVTAVVTNQLVEVVGQLEFVKLAQGVSDQDLGFELSIKDVRDVLQVFKNWNRKALEDDEPVPLIGIGLTEDHVAFYDETGLGLSIWLLAVERKQLSMSPELWRRIEHQSTLEYHESSLQMTHEQAELLSRAAKIMGKALEVHAIEAESGTFRSVVSCGPMTSVITHVPPVEATDGEQEEFDLDDVEDRDDFEDHDSAESTSTLRVVESRPIGGIS